MLLSDWGKIYVYTQAICKSWMRHKVNFRAAFYGFEFRVFLFLDWFVQPRLKNRVCPTIYSKLEGG